MGGFPLGRAFGAEVRAHWTWIILLAIITVFFSTGLSSDRGGGLTGPLSWITGGSLAALIFLSVTVHELAHVAVARRDGIARDVVVIQLLGGTFVLDVRARTPGEEARLAVAGPLLSGLVMIGCGAVAFALIDGSASSAGAPEWHQAVTFCVITLCFFNAFLAGVSLIPAYPMDGGRLLHAVAWRRSRDQKAAAAAVAKVGRLAGGALLLGGAAIAVVLDPVVGLTVGIGGWLLIASGRTMQRRGFLEELVNGLTVGDALDPDPMVLPPQLSLDVVAPDFLGARLGSASLVGRPNELLGLIGSRQVGRVPRRQWAERRVDSAMVAMNAVPSIEASVALWPALEILEQSGLDGLVVRGLPGAEAGDRPRLITRRAASTVVRQRVEERAAKNAGPSDER
jgi:Zn-dependent protease